MDKKQFAEIMADFAHGFLEPRLLEKATLETWYKYLSVYTADDFRQAVDDFVLHATKRPSLSELKTRCNKAKADRECRNV